MPRLCNRNSQPLGRRRQNAHHAELGNTQPQRPERQNNQTFLHDLFLPFSGFKQHRRPDFPRRIAARGFRAVPLSHTARTAPIPQPCNPVI